MKKRIALVENFSLDFLNIRVPLVKYLENKGYDVYAIIPEDSYCSRVKETGVKVLSYKLKKNTLSPLSFIKSARSLKKYQEEYKFSIIHSFRLQPNIITSIIFAFRKEALLINHITGLGFAFAGKTIKSLLYRSAILFLYQISAISADRLIVQNITDFRIISKLFFTSKKLVLIEGSGVDQEKFSKKNIDPKTISTISNNLKLLPENTVISFTGRLLLEKGIIEFLEVAHKLSISNPNLKFIVAGWFDVNNPSCIKERLLYKYLQNKNIIYLGMINEIRELLSVTDIFVLPTYREGFSRSILEAMAMAVPVITTDVAGARDAVINGHNGLLVPAQNKGLLEKAILKLLSDPDLCAKMGHNGRNLVENKFNTFLIFAKMIDVYNCV